MGLMDKMMERMIKNMSVEEKEAMMLKMMPMMMADVDINKMAPGMLTALGRLITLTSIYDFISKALRDNELKAQLNEIKGNLPGVMEKMQSMMAMMMSEMPQMMTGMMSSMMNFMGNYMMPLMMPMMDQMMPQMMAQNDMVKEMMPECMADMMPHCIETFVPLIEPEQRIELASRLTEAMDNVGLEYQTNK